TPRLAPQRPATGQKPKALRDRAGHLSPGLVAFPRLGFPSGIEAEPEAFLPGIAAGAGARHDSSGPAASRSSLRPIRPDDITLLTRPFAWSAFVVPPEVRLNSLAA